MNTIYYLVEPLDVLMLRGNRSFGDAGDHGDAVMPPWPSVFAGAFRSAILGQDASRLAAYSRTAGDSSISAADKESRLRSALGDALFDVLGTPDAPGSFRIDWLSLAQGGLPVVPLPADLLVMADQDGDTMEIRPLDPADARGAGPLPQRAFPRLVKQQKPVTGTWLDAAALAAYLDGHLPESSLLTRELYAMETRLGIGLASDSRTVESGALYTAEAIALRPDTGFLIGIQGLDGVLPDEGMLRLGGDGKGAHYRRVDFAPRPSALRSSRFRLVLASPAVFTQGWVPDGVSQSGSGTYRLQGDGFGADLVCAVVPRHDVVSGWDLAAWRPKTAQRVAPAGSVYWFDNFEGDARKLASWVAAGVWADNAERQRRAEGFNLAWLGEWR